jgi:hypothetical protein
VQKYFPGKEVTPIGFRRILPSIIFKKGIRGDGESETDFMNKYAMAVNTSTSVSLYFLVEL